MPLTTVDYIQLGLMPFEVILSCCFGAKLLHMLDVLYIQTQHDLYFVDWEQPRSFKGGIEEEEEGSSLTDGTREGLSRRASAQRKTGDLHGDAMPVSVWRKIFVANE